MGGGPSASWAFLEAGERVRGDVPAVTFPAPSAEVSVYKCRAPGSHRGAEEVGPRLDTGERE